MKGKRERGKKERKKDKEREKGRSIEVVQKSISYSIGNKNFTTYTEMEHEIC